jgi:hypothetical protein
MNASANDSVDDSTADDDSDDDNDDDEDGDDCGDNVDVNSGATTTRSSDERERLVEMIVSSSLLGVADADLRAALCELWPNAT